MKPLFLTLPLIHTAGSVALAMTETGFDNYRFAGLIGLNLLATLAFLFCLLVLAAALHDRSRQRKQVRVSQRPRPNRRRPTLR